MSVTTIYKPTYDKSWAVIIGINHYRVASPLGYARQDAESFAEILKSAFGFPPDGITVLLDGDATRHGILSSFLQLTKDAVLPDDRVAVFFAGHGCTRTGKHGEVGFLVPVDGDPNELSTLIRWDDLTRNAELIPAKHVLFVMDACYGGLAIQRNIPAGSARFLKDMLQRYSRQVLTAGKADEPVADSGGPRSGHSIFTGHLLEALEGKASDSNGIISANAVMTYVYDHVGKDPHSRQSPHFGFIEGDGDFIFSAPNLVELNKDEKEDKDVLVQVPASVMPSTELPDQQTLLDRTKDYLSDPRYRIRLDDLVASEIRTASYEIREEEFPLNTAVSPADLAQRLRKYETALSRLNAITILLARWGTAEHQPLVERVIARLTDGTELRSGRTAWLGLRWYPIMYLMYSGGVAALSAHNYLSLSTLLTTKLGGSATGQGTQPAVVATVNGIGEVDGMELFKTLPGHERHYAARSEYLFKKIQPDIEDLLFLGNSYEDLFDRFEILYALTYADLSNRPGGLIWGPPGRFGWKGHLGTASPYDAVMEEAKRQGADWALLSSRLFAGSLDRFHEVANAYRTHVIDQLHWF
jgi:Caspase domain